MYNVLVVDDDSACLALLKACLTKWNYEVTTVTHAYDALFTLRNKPYDLVLSDVHMPNMNGFELQRRVNQEFHLPVILISSDSLAEVKGLQNGAQFFLVKPIVANDVKNVWQISVWWKSTMKNKTPPIREISTSSQEDVVRNIAVSYDNFLTEKSRKVVWTRNLHTRFVEALLVLGYHKAVPKNILEIMDVPELTREQVASHLQKYRKLLVRILDGSVDIRNSRWIDYNYYSSSLGGNPHSILLNQLRDQQRIGKLAEPTPVGNLSSTLGEYRPPPPYTPAEGSSNKNMNAMMPNNSASSSVNVTTKGFGSTTLGNASNATMGNNVGSSTISNPVQHLNYEPNQMGHYNKNTLVAPQNYSYRDGGLIGGANNNMFPLGNRIGTSSTVPVDNNFYSNQALYVGGQGSNYLSNKHNINGGQLRIVQHDSNTGILFGANQFGNTIAVNEQQLGGGQMADQNLFNGHIINGGQLTELGIVQFVSPGISFGATNQFENTTAVNEQQLGAGQMTDQNLLNEHNINGGQLTELGIVQFASPGISFGATNQFGNTSAVNDQQLGAGQMADQNLFNGHNINGGQLTELGTVQCLSPGISFGATNQFENTTAVNEQQLGAGQMTDQNLLNEHDINGGQLTELGIVQFVSSGISFGATNQFGNTSAVNEQQLGTGQMADQNLFNGHNINVGQLTELGTVQCVSPGMSFGATNHFENTTAVNEQQLGVGQMTVQNLLNEHNINGGQLTEVGIVQFVSPGISFGATNQFGNTSAVNEQQLGAGQMADQNLFNGHNINGGQLTEVGSVQSVNPGISFGATNQFENTTAVNEQQLGAGHMANQNLFNGHNINGGQLTEVGSVQSVNPGISFGATNLFENTTAVNEQQLGAGHMADQNLFNGHNFNGGQLTEVRSVQSVNPGISFGATNQFENTTAVNEQQLGAGHMANQNLFNGHNINGGQLTEVGSVQSVNPGISFGATNLFENTTAVNEQQLGAGQMTDQNLLNEHNINGGQLTELGIVQFASPGISFGATNQFGNTSAVNDQQLGAGQMADQNLFSGHNINGGQLTELGTLQCASPGISLGATNQFENTTAVNEQQLGGGQMTDLKSWSDNDGLLSPDDSLIDLDLFLGDDGEDFWQDIMNISVADDENVGVANDKDNENSGDHDEDDENSGNNDNDDGNGDYNPGEES